MPVVACPECAKKLNVPDGAAGKRIRCPGCQTAFPVPGAPPRPSPSAATPAPRPAPDLDDAPTPMPPAPRFKKRAQPEPEPLPLDDERDAIAGLRCPKCDAEAVKALPPNQFSRRPGYVCGACETVMRRAGTRGNYFAAVGLGVFVILLAVAMAVLSFDAPRGQTRMIVGAVVLAALGAAAAGWGFQQSRLPEPVGATAEPTRVGFWILVVVIGLLLLGGIVFGLMYVMQEMM